MNGMRRILWAGLCVGILGIASCNSCKSSKPSAGDSLHCPPVRDCLKTYLQGSGDICVIERLVQNSAGAECYCERGKPPLAFKDVTYMLMVGNVKHGDWLSNTGVAIYRDAHGICILESANWKM